ncbi:uncharacterized protein LOC126403102 [Epinephelus moara]|uniref:uncharacterized protein LOC126403102 n=1 Tax=Epinephelus moara TaxID=300413 RepID=UPI00214F400F|nr:uncharacterized protein LOC126403102 [Epinephelus moara]
MDFCFATFAAVLVLLGAASCAPTGHPLHDACGAVPSSSLELNDIARSVSIKARNGSKDVLNFTTTLGWMETKDMCDPETLKQQPATCLGKMLNVLTSYMSAVERVAGFESCSKFVKEVELPIHKLHKDMSSCVKSTAEIHHQKESSTNKEETWPKGHWKEIYLCQYTMDRLFSFSILAARVFAVGDPAHHTDIVAQKCRA